MAAKSGQTINPGGLGESTAQPDAESPATIHGELSPLVLLEIASRHRWVIVFSTIACLVAGVFYLLLATPIYESLSRVYVERSSTRLIGQVDTGIDDAQRYLHTQAEIIRSIPILKRALEKVDWRRTRLFAESRNPAAELQEEIHVSLGRRDQLITVALRSPHSQEAAAIVNAVVEAYMDFHGEHKRGTAAELVDILRNEKVRRDVELTERINAMVQYELNHETLSLEGSKDDSSGPHDRMNRLSQAITNTELDLIEVGAELGAILDIANDPEKRAMYLSAEPGTHGERRIQLMNFIEQIEDELIKLKTSATSDHPSIGRLNDRLMLQKQRLKEYDQQIIESLLGRAKRKQRFMERKLKNLHESLEEIEKRVFELRSQQAEHSLLAAEYERVQKLVDILDERIKEISLDEQVGSTNLSVLEVAEPGEKPVAPRKALVMAIALILGLMIGGTTSLLLEALDQRLRSPDEISTLTSLPVLGVVPAIDNNVPLGDRGRYTMIEPKSALSEAIRTVRTSVFFSLSSGKSSRIAITSPLPSEGKSMICSNLGITMADAGHRTLIIDADLRKPTQHQIFGIDREEGLSRVLCGECKLTDAIQPSGVDRLDVIPAGPTPPNPSELLGSEAFLDMLTSLGEQYRTILFDTPPVLPVTDSRLVSARCDGTLLVLRIDLTGRRALRAASDVLSSLGNNVLGAVANAVRPQGRYGYQAYQYHYYYDDDDSDNNDQRNQSRSSHSSPVETATKAPVSNEKTG